MREKMKKELLPMLLFVIPIALFGGFFTGIYTLEHSTEDMVNSIMEQMQSKKAFYLVSCIQSLIYAVIATIVGYFLANRTGLVKPLRFEKKALIKTVPVILLLGVAFASDYFVFGSFIPEVAADYEKGISISYFLCSLTYGGVIEEVLLRWFFMTLIVWILVLLFARKVEKENIPTWIYVVANIVAALLFAAGHLPTTLMLFGKITPIILLRCFLLNAGFAIVFGRYYRKYGIQYAMLAHGGIHLVSKVILLLIL